MYLVVKYIFVFIRESRLIPANRSSKVTWNVQYPEQFCQVCQCSVISSLYETDTSTSVTRLGYFWKVLVTNFLTKIAEISSCDLFGLLVNHQYQSKNYCGYFLGNIWGILATFYSIIWSHWPPPRSPFQKSCLFFTPSRGAVIQRLPTIKSPDYFCVFGHLQQ